MLDWVAGEIASLVNEQGVPPGRSLCWRRTSRTPCVFPCPSAWRQSGIPVRSHRPSRSLREEPAARCLLTLACLAHPSWGIHPARFDLAYALVQAIQGMDLVRAQLLAEIVYRKREGVPVLSPFEQIKPDVQERITYRFGELYEGLRLWLEESRRVRRLSWITSSAVCSARCSPSRVMASMPASQPGRWLPIWSKSIQKFRWSAGETLAQEGIPSGKEYVLMVQQGVIAAQYVRSWQAGEGRCGAAGAGLYLPDEQPPGRCPVLAGCRQPRLVRAPLPAPDPSLRAQPPLAVGQALDGQRGVRSQHAGTAAPGIRACCAAAGSRVYLGLSELGEQGYEQRGPLLRALNRVLKRAELKMHFLRAPSSKRCSTTPAGKMGVAAVPGSGKTWTLSRLAASHCRQRRACR